MYDGYEVIQMIENFGKNIARLRKNAGYSQQELAEKIAVQKQTISNIERGTRYPTFETLEKFAKVFHATPIQLFGTEKEIAVSDIPEVLDRIDEYDQKVQNILRVSHFFNEFSPEALTRINEQIQAIQNFFFAQPQVDEDGVPSTDQNGEVIMRPSTFSRVPLDELDQIVKTIPLLEDFFFPQPVLEEGEAVIDKEGNVLRNPSRFSQIPLDQLEKTVQYIDTIKQNKKIL